MTQDPNVAERALRSHSSRRACLVELERYRPEPRHDGSGVRHPLSGELDQAQFLVTHLAGPGDPRKRLYPGSSQQQLTDAENWYGALVAGKGSAYLGDYLQLRYLMREFPDEGLRLRRLRSDDLVISYRLMMRNQPELLELVDTAIRYLPPGSLYRDLGSVSASG